jgi:hypothetical protein
MASLKSKIITLRTSNGTHTVRLRDTTSGFNAFEPLIAGLDTHHNRDLELENGTVFRLSKREGEVVFHKEHKTNVSGFEMSALAEVETRHGKLAAKVIFVSDGKEMPSAKITHKLITVKNGSGIHVVVKPVAIFQEHEDIYRSRASQIGRVSDDKIRGCGVTVCNREITLLGRSDKYGNTHKGQAADVLRRAFEPFGIEVKVKYTEWGEEIIEKNRDKLWE